MGRERGSHALLRRRVVAQCVNEVGRSYGPPSTPKLAESWRSSIGQVLSKSSAEYLNSLRGR